MSDHPQPAVRPPRLPPGSYVMGLTPFTRDGALDSGALREHVQWAARENVGFWPASPATGEGNLMSDAEILQAVRITADATAGRQPVVAAGLEFPTAAKNIEYIARARDQGADAVQLYPPTLGHSFVPGVEMLRAFYHEVLSAVDVPIVLSSNLMTGFEVPAAVFDQAVDQYPHVIGLFKNHPDQHNVADFTARFAARTTVLTMTQKLMFSFAAGAAGELDNLQNVAPRLCRSLHDALHRGDMSAAGEAYRAITGLWTAISGFCAEFAAPRIVVYKAILGILGLPGGHARRPYLDLGQDALKALDRVVEAVDLRDREGLR